MACHSSAFGAPHGVPPVGAQILAERAFGAHNANIDFVQIVAVYRRKALQAGDLRRRINERGPAKKRGEANKLIAAAGGAGDLRSVGVRGQETRAQQGAWVTGD